ncbi:MAG: hypothetical protein ACI9O4_001408 [Chitinophagales bacterium]|jgi:hypothetical protein
MQRVFILILLSYIGLGLQAQCVSNTEWEQVIPSENLPEEVKIRDANNNLDLTSFHGKYYMAFRTAPSHFASKKTKLYILSSTDFTTWELEKEIYLESDLREPRFYQKDDRLFFMFFKGGTKMFKFEPQGIYNCYLDYQSDTWSDIKQVDIPLGYVPWRIIEHKEVFYLSTYDGINEYKIDVPSEFRLFSSTDGLIWETISTEPQITHERAIAEIELTFDEHDDIWGVARLEFDGSYIVHASKEDYSKFEFWHSPYKFDSPILFTHQGKHYLIARRNLDGPLVHKEGKHKHNLVRYSFKKKTTALYLLDTENKSIVHIKDFNSTGDCAFPGITKINDTDYFVLNYSSNIDKRKKPWITGQLGKTYIYKSKLTMEDCETFINSSTGQFVYPFE